MVNGVPHVGGKHACADACCTGMQSMARSVSAAAEITFWKSRIENLVSTLFMRALFLNFDKWGFIQSCV
jgi:hypothetical protein